MDAKIVSKALIEMKHSIYANYLKMIAAKTFTTNNPYEVIKELRFPVRLKEYTIKAKYNGVSLSLFDYQRQSARGKLTDANEIDRVTLGIRILTNDETFQLFQGPMDLVLGRHSQKSGLLPIFSSKTLMRALGLGMPKYAEYLRQLGLGKGVQLYAFYVPSDAQQFTQMAQQAGISRDTMNKLSMAFSTCSSTTPKANVDLGYPASNYKWTSGSFMIVPETVRPVITMADVDVYYTVNMQGFASLGLNDAMGTFLETIQATNDDIHTEYVEIGANCENRYETIGGYSIDKANLQGPVNRPSEWAPGTLELRFDDNTDDVHLVEPDSVIEKDGTKNYLFSILVNGNKKYSLIVQMSDDLVSMTMKSDTRIYSAKFTIIHDTSVSRTDWSKPLTPADYKAAWTAISNWTSGAIMDNIGQKPNKLKVIYDYNSPSIKVRGCYLMPIRVAALDNILTYTYLQKDLMYTLTIRKKKGLFGSMMSVSVSNWRTGRVSVPSAKDDFIDQRKGFKDTLEDNPGYFEQYFEICMLKDKAKRIETVQ